LSCGQLEKGCQTEKLRSGRKRRRRALPFDLPAVAGTFTDECGDHLQSSGIDALEGGDVERYRKGFVEKSRELLL